LSLTNTCSAHGAISALFTPFCNPYIQGSVFGFTDLSKMTVKP
jgi:hypothetical protein